MNARAKISSKGQLVLPKAVREAYGLGPGSEVDIESAGDTFDLCPADACAIDRPPVRFTRADPPPELIDAAERIARACHLDVGGVEYLVDDRDGRACFYDINALSNFVANPHDVLGFDPHEQLVDFLESAIA